MNSQFQPVIIIGAARSGTNMLRDALCKLDGFATWPCDEINYLWRSSAARWPNDELPPELASPEQYRRMQNAFVRIARTNGARFVVEKTCANSLRVDYTLELFPDAKYIFLMRDGRDVVASAMKRWRAPFDLRYTLKKARYIRPGDLPYYALRYAGARLHRLASRERRVSTWGPRFSGMREMLSSHSLPEVCAEQWKRCVDASATSFASLGADRWTSLTYESFVADPVGEISQLAAFLGAPANSAAVKTASAGIFPRSVGAWRRDLAEDVSEVVEARLAGTLRRHGYLGAPVVAPPVKRAA